METKTCTKCGREKILLDFVKDKKQRSGYRPSCKQCHKIYLEENKDKIRIKQKLYYARTINKWLQYQHKNRKRFNDLAKKRKT
jgi:hypothetical protein